MIRRVGLTVVVVHALIVVAHGTAHAELGVELSVLQTGYVVVVIAIAPIVASVLLWTRLSRSRWFLLTVSMAAALIFGIYWHYVPGSFQWGIDGKFAIDQGDHNFSRYLCFNYFGTHSAALRF